LGRGVSQKRRGLSQKRRGVSRKRRGVSRTRRGVSRKRRSLVQLGRGVSQKRRGLSPKRRGVSQKRRRLPPSGRGVSPKGRTAAPKRGGLPQNRRRFRPEDDGCRPGSSATCRRWRTRSGGSRAIPSSGGVIARVWSFAARNVPRHFPPGDDPPSPFVPLRRKHFLGIQLPVPAGANVSSPEHRSPSRKDAAGPTTQPESFYGFEPLPARGAAVSNELIDKLRDEDSE
jgi:hypothetical protein